MDDFDRADCYIGDPEKEPDDDEEEDETNHGPDYPIGMNLEPYDLQGDR
jgi:hypothetical protein